MIAVAGWVLLMVAGTATIVLGAELFAEHLAAASAGLGVSSFALALLLAGAEPEELATVITASARGVDGVAFGDVVGANAAVASLALGVGAVVGTLPFGRRARRYALGGLAAALVAGALLWDGRVGRLEGVVLVLGYGAFVASIWLRERAPPLLGEAAELDGSRPGDSRLGWDLAAVVGGLALLTAGSMALVEAARRLASVESTQTRLGLVVVGFATAFELVVLAWSSARRRLTEAVVAAVVGSFAYNVTMSLGLGAIVAPIEIVDVALLRAPYLAMVGLLVVGIALSYRGGDLTRSDGALLVAGYPAFVGVALIAG